MSTTSTHKHLLSIAPMMGRTDRHYRYFMRLLTKYTVFYTEMLTADAILKGNRHHLLHFSPIEKPLVLQVGGSHPNKLAECAKIAEDYNYDEINLNVGCPSERVQQGNFGAILMAEPNLVAECVTQMKQATSIPVSVKHRIGINGYDKYDDLANFVNIVAMGGCDRFIVHARIADLSKLSAQQNRVIPPLRYEDVYQLKRDFSDYTIEINGGISTLEQVMHHLKFVDGVMIGRTAYDNPYLFSRADKHVFKNEYPLMSRRDIISSMIKYMQQCDDNIDNRVMRHMHGLYTNQVYGKKFRSQLQAHLKHSISCVCILDYCSALALR